MKRLHGVFFLVAQVGNCFGFVGNRMLEGYGVEAGFMLEEGALPEDVGALHLNSFAVRAPVKLSRVIFFFLLFPSSSLYRRQGYLQIRHGYGTVYNVGVHMYLSHVLIRVLACFFSGTTLRVVMLAGASAKAAV